MNRPITPSAEEFLARLNAAVDAYLGRTKGQRPQGTKAWLAQQLGCDRTTLYKYLDGTNRIPPDTLRALMSLIGVPENEAYTLLFLGGYGVAAPVAPSPPQREGAISATGLRAALAEDLGADLGAELASPLSLLAGLLVDSAKGHLARDDAEQALAADPDLARLARVLAGREIPAGGAVVSFGTGAQTGDIRMRDLAGRDLVRLAVRANAIYINHFHAGSQAFFGSDAPVAPAPASAPSAQQRAAPAPNPFGRVGRIDNPDEFFDREHLLERIFFELARGINLSLVGEAQIGKSSILAKLCHEGPQRLGLPRNQVLLLDMQLVRDEHDFFEALCDRLNVPSCRGFALSQRLEGRRYILCLDEIEKMRKECFSGGEREELRGLADGSQAPSPW